MKTGYTISEILDADIADLKKLTGKELRSVVATLRDASAKRYKRAVEKGELDPAIVAFRDKYGGKISTAGKTDKELRRELQKGYYFMQAKTSTSAGRAAVRKALEESTGVELTKDQTERLWSVIDKMSELYELGQLPVFAALPSEVVRNYVAKQVHNGVNTDYILSHAEKDLNRIYKELQND